MKCQIQISKKGRKCSLCGMQIVKGEKFIETTEWIPSMKYPLKKNLCFKCLHTHIELIPTLEELLNNLKTLQRTMNQL